MSIKININDLEETIEVGEGPLKLDFNLDSARFTHLDKVLIENEGWVENKKVIRIDAKTGVDERKLPYKVKYDFVSNEEKSLEEFDTIEEVKEENLKIKIENLHSSALNLINNRFSDLIEKVSTK